MGHQARFYALCAGVAQLVEQLSTKYRYSDTPASAINTTADAMVRAIMDAFFTSNPRRQTDRRIPGRTWAGVSGQPAPSRICRICTAEHRPVLVCRIQRKTFLCSPHRSYTSSRLPAIPAFWCRIPGRIFRLPSRRTADNSSFRRQALVPAFYCHSSGRIFR